MTFLGGIAIALAFCVAIVGLIYIASHQGNQQQSQQSATNRLRVPASLGEDAKQNFEQVLKDMPKRSRPIEKTYSINNCDLAEIADFLADFVEKLLESLMPSNNVSVEEIEFAWFLVRNLV